MSAGTIVQAQITYWENYRASLSENSNRHLQAADTSEPAFTCHQTTRVQGLVVTLVYWFGFVQLDDNSRPQSRQLAVTFTSSEVQLVQSNHDRRRLPVVDVSIARRETSLTCGSMRLECYKLVAHALQQYRILHKADLLTLTLTSVRMALRRHLRGCPVRVLIVFLDYLEI